MATHGLREFGTGSTTAATKKKIGSTITLPAGGPWTIQYVWGQVATVTAVPDEGTGGILHIDALTGDLTPDPAPGKYPLIGHAISESAASRGGGMPLNLWPVNWQASGKAQIDLSYTNLLAITTAPAVAAGIIFGDSMPEVRPLKFCDVVSTSFASATEQTVGTITLAEKATRLVGVLADLGKGDAITTAEPCMAAIRLDSADIKLPPSQFPCDKAWDSSDGTAVGAAFAPRCDFIPLDISVVGGARIDVFVTSTQSVTGNADIHVYLAYE